MTGLLLLLSLALGLLIALLAALLAWEMAHPPRRTAGWAMARGLPCDPGELGWQFENWHLDRPDGAMLPVWEIECARKTAKSDEGLAVSDQHSAVSDQQSAFSEQQPAISDQRSAISGHRSPQRLQQTAACNLRKGPAKASLTAVFVHGWGHSRLNALSRIEAFKPFVDRIVLYDLRGHGEASGTSRLGDQEDRDLLALLERLGHDRFVLVGHSMGAVIAIHAAMKACAQPLAPGSAGGYDSKSTSTAIAHWSSIAGVIAYGPYCEFRRSLRGRIRVRGLPVWPMADVALLIHRMRGVTPLSLDPVAMHALPLPLLIIHGANDAVSPLDHAQRIAKATPLGMLIEVAGAAHADAHEIDEAKHVAALQKFFSDLTE